MKKIAVITATRAEYGLLQPVVKELRSFENDALKIELVVTGTHLAEEFGMTKNEILADGVRIDEEVRIPTRSVEKTDIAHNQAETLIKFTDLFAKKAYDAIVILG
nr:UDP-N-acetylglucosamine 2-epimerase [Lachnospiraceae bacterium]